MRKSPFLAVATVLALFAAPAHAQDLESATIDFEGLSADSFRVAPPSGEDLSRLEGVIDTPDFVRISELPEDDPDRTPSKAIGHIIGVSPRADGKVAVGFCTGFLLSPSLFMTNHHCTHDKNGAQKNLENFRVHFDYYDGMRLVDRWKSAQYRFAGMLVADKRLDYALLALHPKASPELGYLKIDVASEAKKRVGSVKIIQHPEGRPKEIVRENSDVVGRYQDFVHYEADTEGGSSGSPVIAVDSGKVIALHRAGRLNKAGDFIRNEGAWLRSILQDIYRKRPPENTEIDRLVTNNLEARSSGGSGGSNGAGGAVTGSGDTGGMQSITQ